MTNNAYIGDAKGNIAPDAMQIITTFASYAEISASGTGVHIICKGKLPPGGCKKANVEMYDQRRYFIMTGDAIQPYSEIRECQEHINALHGKVFADRTDKDKKTEAINKTPQGIEFAPSNQAAPPVDEEKIKQIILKSKNSNLFFQLINGDWNASTMIDGKKYASQSEADLALLGMLAFYTGKNAALMKVIFKNSGLYRTKCDEKRGPEDVTYPVRHGAK